ncbi:MAG: hotdog domain-containing protein [Alphaproteobacteria bacterium]
MAEAAASLVLPYVLGLRRHLQPPRDGLLMTLVGTARLHRCFDLGGLRCRHHHHMHIRFLSACPPDATAEARIIKFGKTLCPMSVEICGAESRRMAVARTLDRI